MRLIIFAAFIVLASAFEDDVSSLIKEKRQIPILGAGLPLYGGYGYGAYPYGGIYPGGYVGGLGVYGRKRREVAEDIEEVDDETKDKRQILLGAGLPVAGYGLGYGLPLGGYGVGYGAYPAVWGRKRRDVAEEEASKEKRHLLIGGGVLPVAGYGVGYGLPVGGYGLGYGYGGYGLGLGGVDTGFGVPAVYGRKRREVAEDDSAKDKRQILLGAGLPIGGYGVGYGLPLAGYGLGYGLGYGGYPAVYGRKRRDVAEEVSANDKRQILLGAGLPVAGYGVGYGLPVAGYGLGYGLGYGGLGGYPAVYGRKRRDVDDVADKAATEKRQVIGAYPAVGAYPVGGVVGAYPVGGVVGAYPVGGVVGGYPLGGVVGGYPGIVGGPGVIL